MRPHAGMRRHATCGTHRGARALNLVQCERHLTRRSDRSGGRGRGEGAWGAPEPYNMAHLIFLRFTLSRTLPLAARLSSDLRERISRIRSKNTCGQTHPVSRHAHTRARARTQAQTPDPPIAASTAQAATSHHRVLHPNVHTQFYKA
ncbi:unnamed protein product, partial [Iphiclides podalirius]